MGQQVAVKVPEEAIEIASYYVSSTLNDLTQSPMK